MSGVVMHSNRIPASLAVVLVTLFAGALPSRADAQQNQPPQQRPAVTPRAGASALGVDVFGTAGVTWPTAEESFEALKLDSTAMEFGGGARVNGLWKDLFAQVAVSRWSDTGERAFVDSSGNVFPLGIPLDVKATYVEVSAGWKTAMRNENGRITALPYIGAGAGLVNYSETSPFAEPGDDLERRTASYHVLLGAEVPIGRWFAVAVDGRYRFVPNLLGDEGVSAALEDDILGGAQVTVGLRVGFGGPPHVQPPLRPAPEPQPQPRRPLAPGPVRPETRTGVITQSAPAYLRPDPTRTPLRTLAPGTSVTILEETGGWLRVEFPDPQYGPRVGYVERKFVQIRQ